MHYDDCEWPRDTIEQSVCRQRTEVEDYGVSLRTALRQLKVSGAVHLDPKPEPFDLD